MLTKRFTSSAAVARATTKLETSNAELLQRVRAVADARADEAAAAHAQNTELESAYERAQLQSAGVKRAAENIHTQFDEMQAAAASEREENQRKQAMSGALRRELALLRSHRNAEKVNTVSNLNFVDSQLYFVDVLVLQMFLCTYEGARGC